MSVTDFGIASPSTASPSHPAAAADTRLAGTADARRDFLSLAAVAMGGVGAAGVAWPLVASLGPAADTLSTAFLEVDLAPVQPGQAITVAWGGRPVFIRHRTAAEIAAARAVPLTELKAPASDESRTQRPEWLVVLAQCTHAGCIPLGQKPVEPRGDYGGWFCPCHGSQYDTSGRIRRGPAPGNL
jgi:ubiquinol-cytochrome c reductase iron-sulfur subunit